MKNDAVIVVSRKYACVRLPNQTSNKNQYMKKSKVVIFGICLLWCTTGHSQAVNLAEASLVAENWIKTHSRDLDIEIADHRLLSRGEKTLAYCFSLDPIGYLVISNDKSLDPLIAYSFDNEFDNPPPTL